MNTFSIKNLTDNQKKLRKRILELSHDSNFSHLGSCLSAIDLIDGIYKIKRNDDKFVLSNGHAAIALYTVLEKHGFLNKSSIKNLRVHPDRNIKYGIHVSTGSLGQGLPIALGMAIADKNRHVYCMLSDGECAEGSVWEALRIAWEEKAYNLKIIVNANGWSAYDKVNLPYLAKRIKAFGHNIKKIDGHNDKIISETLKDIRINPALIFGYTSVEQFPFLIAQDAHYYTMKNDDLDLAINLLS